MFDIGFGELFLIAVVALVVLGPEKLPRAARFAGLWVRKARAQWYSVKSEFENDLAADELKRSLAETRESLRQAESQLREGAETVRNRVQKEFDDVAAAATATASTDAESANAEPGVEPGEGAEQDAETQGEGQPIERHQFDEEERSMESAKHMDWEPPEPADEDEDAQDAQDEHPTPPKQADDAHAGR
jgi:sec-independent protein translocase protein TatB